MRTGNTKNYLNHPGLKLMRWVPNSNWMANVSSLSNLFCAITSQRCAWWRQPTGEHPRWFVNNTKATESTYTSTENFVFTKNLYYSTFAGVLHQCNFRDTGRILGTSRHLLTLERVARAAEIAAKVIIDAETETFPELSAAILIAIMGEGPKRRLLRCKLRTRAIITKNLS